MAVNISTGVPYHISTAFTPTKLLGMKETGGFIWLGDGVEEPFQRWAFQAVDGSSGYRIQSHGVPFIFATRIGSNHDPNYVWSNAQEGDMTPTTWYITATDASEEYYICGDPDCSSHWIPDPRSMDPPFTSDWVAIQDSSPNGTVFERWKLTALASTESSSSTSSVSSSIPSSAATISQSTSTGDPLPSQSGKAEQPQEDPQILKQCEPCGNMTCSFTPSGPPTKAYYNVLFGQPVYNCDPGSEESTKTKLGGTFELQQTFSVEVSASVGFGFMGPSVSMTTTISQSESKKTVQTQEIEVTIRPGQAGALVANVSYTTAPGRMDVGGSTYAFVGVHPEQVIGYSVVYTTCGTEFQAFALPKAECSGAISDRPLASRATRLALWMVAFYLAVILA